MTIECLKERIYDLVLMFFKSHSTKVIWSEQINTMPKLPYLTLKLGSVNRTAFPVISQDGERYYPAKTTLEINLYTRGKKMSGDSWSTPNYGNTAVEDMLGFVNFLESDFVTDLTAEWGFGMSLMETVRDLTALQNDSAYRYRSMAEFFISFDVNAGGGYGISGFQEDISTSGGGTAEMANTEEYILERAEIEGGNE